MTDVLPIFVPEDVAKAKALCIVSQLVTFGARSYRSLFPSNFKALHSCEKSANTNLLSDRAITFLTPELSHCTGGICCGMGTLFSV
jgi:hypothetical protein